MDLTKGPGGEDTAVTAAPPVGDEDYVPSLAERAGHMVSKIVENVVDGVVDAFFNW